MTTVIRAGAEAAEYQTPVTVEKLVVIAVDGGAAPYELYLMLVRVDGSTWILGSPNMTVAADDLGVQAIIPVANGAALPEQCLPCVVWDEGVLDVRALGSLRARAAALRNALRAPAALLSTSRGPPTGSAWFYADPSHEKFAEEVEPELYVDAARLSIVGLSGLLTEEVDDETPENTTATFVEQVPHAEYEEWLQTKRLGPGRETRLLSHPPITGAGTAVVKGRRKPPKPPRLFRDVYSEFNCVEFPRLTASTSSKDGETIPAEGAYRHSYELPHRLFGKSPPALADLLDALATSGVEPTTFVQEYCRLIGLSPKSGLAKEVTNIILGLYYAAVIDGIDPSTSAAWEHFGRRFLQIQRAVRKDPKSPSFEGLDGYMSHISTSAYGVKSAIFDKHLAEDAKVEALVLKQMRINKSELEKVGQGKKKKKKNEEEEDDDDE